LRHEFLDKLTKLENHETNLEHECKRLFPPFLTGVNSIDNRLDEMQELREIERIEEEAGLKKQIPVVKTPDNMAGSFMSESVYGKLNSPQARKRRAMSNYRIDYGNIRTNFHSCITKTP
jgi:hypothetical protein